MKKFKCYDCGCIFKQEDARKVKDHVGDFWGAPAYRDISVCPDCGSDDFYSYSEDDEEDDE